ncbi:MAG: putative exported protein [Gammaproteobacteria bacterium]|nr:putative exported protein [Gammaproteobacteria bacterium]
MAMHNTNSLLKYVAIPVCVIIIVCIVASWIHRPAPTSTKVEKEKIIKNLASNDSAAESLDTLTADLSTTKQKILEVAKNNEAVKKQNTQLLNQINATHTEESGRLREEIEKLKNQIKNLPQKTEENMSTAVSSQPITVVDDLTQAPKNHPIMNLLNNHTNERTELGSIEKNKSELIPYYTIPANGTSVQDKLMTALVGRIPVKGIVTDPYPFKIVISDDNLAANGLRIPHLLQMVVSGYCEGDLNLMSVRGWITSLTFVFDDGTISSTTSNDNDIGNYTKSNSLGYLSDKYGNPFIRGKLITNAPAYLAGGVAINAGVGAANAYAQSQTTHSDFLGKNATSVTGSPGKYVAGQAMSSAANELQQWWHDREEQSFDAIYVAPMDEENRFVEIAVNFAKEIHIDYDPKGRKLNYAHDHNAHVSHGLD